MAKSDKTDKGEKAAKATDAKVDAKSLAATAGSDGTIDAKFDDVKSGATPAAGGARPAAPAGSGGPGGPAAPAGSGGPGGPAASAAPAGVERVEPHDGAPKLGDGPKSATHNELPTEPEPPARARAETMAMPVIAPVGAPPAMPAGNVENPTNMPGPKAIPAGAPTDAAMPPGTVPPGDSRSLRRGDEFALVYRQGTAVISRFGTIGQRGQWRVVEYPTSSSASNAYAKECSRFVGEGFSDYRE